MIRSLDMMLDRVPDEAVRNRIFVDKPGRALRLP